MVIMEGDVSSGSGLKRPRAAASLCRAMEYGSREKHLVFSAWLEPEGYCGYCGMGFISILLHNVSGVGSNILSIGDGFATQVTGETEEESKLQAQ